MSQKRPLPGQKQNLLFYLKNHPSEKRQTNTLTEQPEQLIEMTGQTEEQRTGQREQQAEMIDEHAEEQHEGQIEAHVEEQQTGQMERATCQMEEDREGQIEDTEGQIGETPQSNSRARRVVLWLEQQHIDPFSNRSGPLHGHLLPEGAATRTTGVQSAVLKIHVATRVLQM